jgi:FkbH-like protein
MEVAEVSAAFPDMECIAFPKGDSQRILELFKHLREKFGKPQVTNDDLVRLRSIRDAESWRNVAQGSPTSLEEFLKHAEALVEFERVQPRADGRAFELINKTNQFNLNGKRLSEAEWGSFFKDPSAFALSVTYKDKFGLLGTIAVIMGKVEGRVAHVNAWVMSCRAFSRRIEHQSVKYLFGLFGVDEIVFDYQPTPRNEPTKEFLKEVLGEVPEGQVLLSRTRFERNLPALFHQVEGVAYA